MTVAADQRDPLVGELLAVLDETIDLQQETLQQLQTLSEAILAHDDAALTERMDALGRTPDRLEAVARKRNAVRTRLARAAGCPVGEMTLDRVARGAAAPQAGAVRRRRERLRGLAETVRRQHLETAVLMAEVARVNRSILTGLFPGAAGAGTYRTDGTAPWQPGHGLLDARR